MVKLPKDVALSLRPSAGGHDRKRLNTWQSVRADVLGRIRSGEWAPGELIPTEHDLAIELGCARATVNRALRELAESGIILRRRKVGTRVAATPTRRTTLEMPVLRDEIEALGAIYDYRMTDYTHARPTLAAMRALHVSDADDLVLIKSKYLANGKPHCCEAIWLNPRHLPPLSRDLFETQSPHEWLARKVPVTDGHFTILAEGASGVCADNLDVAPGTPVLTIERVNSSGSAPVSYARQFYPPQHRLIFDD